MSGTRHPAKWSAAVLEHVAAVVAEEADRLGRKLRVFDPFAGVGRERLAWALGYSHDVWGLELEPEWAEQDPSGLTVVGNALLLPSEWRDAFDVMVTSPTYGNRMADSHDNRDACGDCAGTGDERATNRAAGWSEDRLRCFVPCKNCKGDGRSVRNTYKHALDRMPSDGSSAVLQWGNAYRRFHDQAWSEALAALHSKGLAVVNVSNHLRDGSEQRVVEYHLSAFMLHGCTVEEVRKVPTPRQRKGTNGDQRVDGERVLVLRAPERKGML